MADYIGFKFTNNNKTRRQIIKQLLSKQLLDSTKSLRNQRLFNILITLNMLRIFINLEIFRLDQQLNDK